MRNWITSWKIKPCLCEKCLYITSWNVRELFTQTNMVSMFCLLYISNIYIYSYSFNVYRNAEINPSKTLHVLISHIRLFLLCTLLQKSSSSHGTLWFRRNAKDQYKGLRNDLIHWNLSFFILWRNNTDLKTLRPKSSSNNFCFKSEGKWIFCLFVFLIAAANDIFDWYSALSSRSPNSENQAHNRITILKNKHTNQYYKHRNIDQV